MSRPIDTAVAEILRRRDAIREWLATEAPGIGGEQRHLDEGSPARAYWSHGYQAALDDVAEFVSRTSRGAGSADTSMS
jgi:hypothetical protein